MAAEIRGFQKLWKGGSGPSRYGWPGARWRMKEGGVDIDDIYEVCIRPYAIEGATVLDIGTNGGFWLSRMDKATDLVGIDVLSASHLNFWMNIHNWCGPQVVQKTGFAQVIDFSCDPLEDDYFDLIFSYDVFCHISYVGAQEYLKNLFPKMKSGANGFIMIADQDKYPIEGIGRAKLCKTAGILHWDSFVEDYNGVISRAPGRWYFYGTDKFCKALERSGYEVVSRDVTKESCEHSPVIHFRKP